MFCKSLVQKPHAFAYYYIYIYVCYIFVGVCALVCVAEGRGEHKGQSAFLDTVLCLGLEQVYSKEHTFSNMLSPSVPKAIELIKPVQTANLFSAGDQGYKQMQNHVVRLAGCT